MRPEDGDLAYFWDMVDAAEAIEQFLVGKTFEDYVSSRLLRGAVERHLEIIGEAARKVSADSRTSHPEIPWKLIIGQRHVQAHDYGEIKHERVWAVVPGQLRPLISYLKPLLS